MKPYQLYTEDRWKRYCLKVAESEKTFKLKTYPHFDPYFNFYVDHERVHELIKDPTLMKIAEYSFLPFVKILAKVPRYKYQQEEDHHALETKIRPISFAGHFDSYVYGFYSFALTEVYQDYIKLKGFDECILAYRTDLNGKCNIQFAKEVFELINDKINLKKHCSVIAFDISGYFDNIDHNKLKEKWCEIIAETELPKDQYTIFKTLTRYSYVNKNGFLKHFKVKSLKDIKFGSLLELIPNNASISSFQSKFNLMREAKLVVRNLPKKEKSGKLFYRGIPQGSAMSSTLSNIYLIEFDQWLFDLSKKMDFQYRRYCDDLIVICNSEDEIQLRKTIVAEIQKYHLTIQEKKTELIEFQQNSKGKIRSFNKERLSKPRVVITATNEQSFYKNLQYLGFEYNGEKIYIRPTSLSRYFRKMKARIVKSVLMAYSKHSTKNKILRKQIYERYTHLGKYNFLKYVRNSAQRTYKNSKGEVKQGMDSVGIKHQLSRHFAILEKEIFKTSNHQYVIKQKSATEKIAKGKRVTKVRFKI